MDDELSIRTSREGTTATVAAEGEIDLSTVDELRSAVTGAADGVDDAPARPDRGRVHRQRRPRRPARAALDAARRAVTLQISAGDGPVRQAMEITGLSELLAR